MRQKVHLREKDRVRRKKRIRHAISGCMLIGLVSFGIVKGYEYLLRSPYLTLKEIKIQGTKLISAEDIFRECRIQAGQNILKVDLTRIKRELAKFAEFRKVTVQRNLPHQIEIRIQERTPIGIIKFHSQGKEKKVAFDCEVVKFWCSQKDFDSLPLVTGIVPMQEKKSPFGRSTAGRQIVKAGEIIQQLQQQQIFAEKQVIINMRDLQNPVIETGEFGEVRLGKFSPAVLQVKLKYLKQVVEDLERKNQQAKYIDLRFFENSRDSIYVYPVKKSKTRKSTELTK